MPILLQACGGAKTKPSVAPADSTYTATLPLSAYDYRQLEGLYQGDFGGSDIRLFLSHATGRHATGYTLHKGLRRNCSGAMQPAANGFSFELNEPGDNPYDGAFRFSIDTTSLALSGNWKPFKQGATPPKNYVLERAKEIIRDSTQEAGNSFLDSLENRYVFNDNGLVTFQTYRDANGRETKQQQTARGNWTLRGNTYTIAWGANNLLPERQMTFQKVEDTSIGISGYFYLKGSHGLELYLVEVP